MEYFWDGRNECFDDVYFIIVCFYTFFVCFFVIKELRPIFIRDLTNTSGTEHFDVRVVGY